MTSRINDSSIAVSADLEPVADGDAELVELPAFTTEELQQAAQQLVGQADLNAQNAARPGFKGYAIINYPGEIPPLHRAAVDMLKAEGKIICGYSKGTFNNCISFHGREVARVS